MPKQILLADDSITIQKVIALTFAGEDYKITSVDNGADAITKAREIRPDIILADVMMPQKNGYEVCETIKNDPDMKDTPVLLLAGTFEPFDEDQAKKAGADGHIIKPFESQALIQKVKELVGAGAAMPAAQPKPVAPAGQVAPPKPPAPPVAVPATPISRPVAPAVPVVAPVSPRPVVPPTAAVATPQPVAELKPIAPAPPKPQAPPTMATPVIPPTAPPAPEPIVPPVAAPAPPEEEDFWGTFVGEAEEKEAPVEKLPSETPMAATSEEEEVWDIGEFEEASPLEEAAPAGEKEEKDFWESFAFEGTEEAKVGEVMEAPLLIEEAAPAEEELVFVEAEPGEVFVEPTEEPIEILIEEPAQIESEEFAFLEEETEVPSIPEGGIEPSPQFVPEGYEQTFEPEAVSREVSFAPPAEPLTAPPSPPATLSEEQLRAALSQVSREVIEKIVWEVVPDLAEMLIKEEIKRLQKKQ